MDKKLTGLEFTSGIKVGWNLGNTLDAAGTRDIMSETSWGNPLTTEEMMLAVRDAGFNAVRIPVTWGNHMDEDHNIDADWTARVKQVVDYAYNNGLYVILNTHHESWIKPYESSREAAAEIMKAVWAQIAEVFKEYGEHLIFEGMNEPRMVGTEFEWNGGSDEGHAVVNFLNRVFVDTVRASGGNNARRFLMVSPYAASDTRTALAALELPDDSVDRLIVSVHTYTPNSFAQNTAINRSITCESDKWRADDEACTRDIELLAKNLDELFISKGTAVIVGEFGAVSKNNEEYRAEWVRYYLTKFKKLGIPCFIWDNGAFDVGEIFGLLDRHSCTWKFPRLMAGIMEGAGAAKN